MTIELSRRHLFAASGAGAAALALPAAAAPSPPTPAPAALPIPFAPKPGIAQLSRNENPYGPAPSALRAIHDHAASGCYYAHAGEAKLIAMIAERHGLTPAHVMTGAGSAEVLNCAIAAHGAGGEALGADLTFDPPLQWAEGKGVTVKRVPLAADMGVDLPAMAAAVGPQTRVVHVCNPNNPTGLLLSPAAVRRFADEVMPRAVLVMDEAYNELTDDPAANSLVDRVRAGDNLIVARTFSKVYGMAGLRVGYALGRPDLIARMRPWSMNFGGNTAGIAAAIASYADEAYIRTSRERIFEARAILQEATRKAGLETLPTAGNFLFVKVPDADRLQAAMEKQGILIRGAYGPWKQWSRVSCGRIEDVKRYAAALPQALSA